MKRKGILIITFFLFLALAQPAYAGSWGESFAAMTWKQMMERAYKAIDDMLLSQIKIQATVVINKKVQVLVSGSAGSGPNYITNYQNFIFNNSQRQGQIMTTDVFRSLNSGVSGNVRSMNRNVEMALNNQLNGGMGRANIDKLVNGGISGVFDPNRGGGRTAFMASIANPFNNPFGTYLNTSATVNETIRRQQIVAQTEEVAGQGFISKKGSDNLISLPASTIKDLTTESQSLPQKIVAAAQSLPEVVGAMASSILNSTIQMGFQKVTQPMDKTLVQVGGAYRGGLGMMQSAINTGQNVMPAESLTQRGTTVSEDRPWLSSEQKSKVDSGSVNYGASSSSGSVSWDDAISKRVREEAIKEEKEKPLFGW